MIVALCPSRGRPEEAARTLASFLATRRNPATRLLFLVDSDDPRRAQYPEGYTQVVPATGTMAGALAQGVKYLGDATAAGMIGDDNIFVTPGWDVTFGAWFAENVGIAFGDDGHQEQHFKNRGYRLPTSWWLSRPIIDRLGMTHPDLRHYYMDNYWHELGTAAHCLRYFPDVLIEHLHPLWKTAPEDATYARGGRHATHDRAFFMMWKRRQFDEHLARLRSAIRQHGPRRVFADWHHPALWESLSILFEDRFGWELYAPIGMDWAKDVWRFTHQDWTAEDYLLQPSARATGDHFEVTPAEYPTRPRKLVTVDQAEQMTWDYVVASVGAHQQPFGKLARRWGARLIHQVGDAKRHVDNSVSQVILASSKAASTHRGAITYHQEFDRDLFGYSPPIDRNAVSAIMLRLDSASCDYRWMADAKGVKWSAVGGEDERAASYLTPASKIADLMRHSGWIWHDKKIGDGYGHVLHNAASMGRPLIGHASHYKGQLGEQFWRDLETCIDLDRHPPERALRLWKAINADPEWHAEMSANLARLFSETVNFDAEAERIRAVLA